MAEFGENLRKAREASGMTQQTLADKIYVTRQAVSRWEGGSRYPDLMTAKKLAQILGTTLDALVQEDEMTALVERNPVAEFPLSKRIQTALMTFCFAPYLLCSLLYTVGWILTFFHASPDDAGGTAAWFTLVKLAGTYLLTALSGYGLYMSVKDNITPGIAAVIGGVFFGIRAAEGLLSLLSMQQLIFFGWLLLALRLAAGAVTALYFSGRHILTPRAVYAIAVVYALASVMTSVSSGVSIAHSFTDAVLTADSSGLQITGDTVVYYFFTSNLPAVFASAALLLLLCYMAYELNAKRLIGAACADGKH